MLCITVCFAPAARVVHSLQLQLPEGACVRDAVALCAQDVRFEGAFARGQLRAYASIWGVKAAADQVLQDQDRIELCRPLRVDPKVARRERFAKQGARSAGLFAKRRPGAKPGY